MLNPKFHATDTFREDAVVREPGVDPEERVEVEGVRRHRLLHPVRLGTAEHLVAIVDLQVGDIFLFPRLKPGEVLELRQFEGHHSIVVEMRRHRGGDRLHIAGRSVDRDWSAKGGVPDGGVRSFGAYLAPPGSCGAEVVDPVPACGNSAAGDPEGWLTVRHRARPRPSNTGIRRMGRTT